MPLTLVGLTDTVIESESLFGSLDMTPMAYVYAMRSQCCVLEWRRQGLYGSRDL